MRINNAGITFYSIKYWLLVEVAVCALEDNPLMDAGHGSVLNAAGEVEMDAMIADGCTYVKT